MITKKDFQEMFQESDKRWDKKLSTLKKEIKDDIEEVVAQFADTMVKMLGMVATKDDLKNVEDRLIGVESDVRDIKRNINDLKADTPTPQEFADHERRITKLEKVTFSVTA